MQKASPWLSGKESACKAGDTGDVGSVPSLGRSLEERNGSPLQYSCLENPTDRGAWQATAQGLQRGRHSRAQYSTAKRKSVDFPITFQFTVINFLSLRFIQQ